MAGHAYTLGVPYAPSQPWMLRAMRKASDTAGQTHTLSNIHHLLIRQYALAECVYIGLPMGWPKQSTLTCMSELAPIPTNENTSIEQIQELMPANEFTTR